MGLLLLHADRLADLVLRVALAINAELLCEDLLDSPAVLVRLLHNFLCKGYPMRLARFAVFVPALADRPGSGRLHCRRETRQTTQLPIKIFGDETRSVGVSNSGMPTYISTNSTNSNDSHCWKRTYQPGADRPLSPKSLQADEYGPLFEG
jgi:hypothetical protein